MALQLAKYIFSLPFIPPSYFAHLLRSQLFTTLPLPTTSYTSKTIIITGANGGLGLEAARHYVRLGAARVILACRSTERGEKAKAAIVLPPPRDDGQTQIIEVWPLDLCSFESVKSFCKRAQKELDRLDVLLLNAGVAMGDFELSDGGYETTITTNVISTFLVAVLLLPLLRRTGIERNEESHLTVVASEAHYFTAFKERHEDKMFEAFKKNDQFYWGDRYGVSKLLDLLLAREMAERLDRRAGGAGKIPIIVNSVNPGLCGATALFRSVPWFVSVILSVLSWIMARSSDQGARILMAAAEGGKETHGKYIDSGKVHDPSPFVLSEEGKQAGKKAWVELMDILESIEPGSTFMLG